MRRVVDEDRSKVDAWARALDVAHWYIAPTDDALAAALHAHDDVRAASLPMQLDYCDVMLVPNK
jgi:hypothetical protein